MAFSTQPGAAEFEEKEFVPSHSSTPMTAAEQAGKQQENEQLKVSATIDTEELRLIKDRGIWVKEPSLKIETTGFSPNYPWLPPTALRLLDKLKLNPINQKELVSLMETVADRATEHFQLTQGKFVALTFYGRVVEVSDTRVGLLKSMQGRKFSEQTFVWRIGFKAFSGRI
jgi:hypothetical protein